MPNITPENPRAAASLNRIRAVIFDLDNTLIDNDAALRKTFEYFNTEYPGAFTGGSRDFAAGQFRYHFRAGHPPLDECYDEFRRGTDNARLPDFKQFKQFWHDFYPISATPFPETRCVLDELKQKFKLAMITNGPSHFQNIKLDSSELRGYFGTIVISGELGIHKPDTGIFRHMADLLALPPGDCVYIGDLPETDIAGAKSAGMRTVLRAGFAPPPGRPESQPDAVINSLTELTEIILA